jgi:hypothetical protein
VPNLPRRDALAQLCTFVFCQQLNQRVEGRRSGGRHRTLVDPVSPLINRRFGHQPEIGRSLCRSRACTSGESWLIGVQAFRAEHGIVTQAWSPIGGITFHRDGHHSSTLRDPVIGGIA